VDSQVDDNVSEKTLPIFRVEMTVPGSVGEYVESEEGEDEGKGQSETSRFTPWILTPNFVNIR
jgi:hypothetical protein